MKNFKEYLAESVKECHYVIKLATQPSDEQVDAAETYLKKFDLIELDTPVKLENDNIDFSNIRNKNIWAIRFVTGMPLSQYVLMQNIKTVMGVPEEYIVVRAANEPIQIEAELSASAIEDADKGSSARLSTDRFYDDAEQPQVTGVYGDEYNKKFLDYLANVADTRKTDRYEAPAPLFSWLEMDKVKDTDVVKEKDFNERFDTVKPVSKGKDTDPVDPKFLGRAGNFDDTAATKVKFGRTKSGDRKAESGPRAKLKTEKVR